MVEYAVSGMIDLKLILNYIYICLELKMFYEYTKNTKMQFDLLLYSHIIESF